MHLFSMKREERTFIFLYHLKYQDRMKHEMFVSHLIEESDWEKARFSADAFEVYACRFER